MPEPVSSGSMQPSRNSPETPTLSEMFRHSPLGEQGNPEPNKMDEAQTFRSRAIKPVTVREGIISQPNEQTALLLKKVACRLEDSQNHGSAQDIENQKAHLEYSQHKFWILCAKIRQNNAMIARRLVHPKSWDRQAIWDQAVRKPLSFIPPIILGLLLNVLDALSYGRPTGNLERIALTPTGMILFPLGQPIFANLGPDGMSMFYVSCIVSQLVYSLGGSIFRGGIGSEMVKLCSVSMNLRLTSQRSKWFHSFTKWPSLSSHKLVRTIPNQSLQPRSCHTHLALYLLVWSSS